MIAVHGDQAPKQLPHILNATWTWHMPSNVRHCLLEHPQTQTHQENSPATSQCEQAVTLLHLHLVPSCPIPIFVVVTGRTDPEMSRSEADIASGFLAPPKARLFDARGLGSIRCCGATPRVLPH